jgi:hypothetical protein
MKRDEKRRHMEFQSKVIGASLDVPLQDLTEAMERTQIHSFGWPIGIVLPSPEFRPKPYVGGIKAEIDAGESYDEWSLSKTGEFRVWKTLFEDRRKAGVLYLDTRIIRTAEVIRRTAALYNALLEERPARMYFRLKHGGLEGLHMGVASPNRFLAFERTCHLPEFSHEYTVEIPEMLTAAGLKATVFDYITRLFELFDMFKVDRALVDELVDNFLMGRTR